MRKRMIDPEFWLDEKLSGVSAYARLLYIGLWQLCDDHYATFPNRSKWIKAQVFPYDSVNIEKLLQELEEIRVIKKFVFEDQEFYYIPHFFDYQRVEKPSKSKYPQYSEADSVSSRGVVGEDSVRAPAEVKLSEVKLSKEKRREDKGGCETFIEHYNKQFGKSYQVTTDRREKLRVRLTNFSLEQILQAVSKVSRSPFHTGKNDRKWIADPDWIIRSDENVDKCLNLSVKAGEIDRIPDYVKNLKPTQ